MLTAECLPALVGRRMDFLLAPGVLDVTRARFSGYVVGIALGVGEFEPRLYVAESLPARSVAGLGYDLELFLDDVLLASVVTPGYIVTTDTAN